MTVWKPGLWGGYGCDISVVTSPSGGQLSARCFVASSINAPNINAVYVYVWRGAWGVRGGQRCAGPDDVTGALRPARSSYSLRSGQATSPSHATCRE